MSERCLDRKLVQEVLPDVSQAAEEGDESSAAGVEPSFTFSPQPLPCLGPKTEHRRREALWDLFQSECAFLYDHLMVLKNVSTVLCGT